MMLTVSGLEARRSAVVTAADAGGGGRSGDHSSWAAATLGTRTVSGSFSVVPPSGVS